ncbi:ABC transporter permease [Polaromonas sp. JS666]|uniref:ABC transporter permease n=1 Tax=Polaromonas sp. (strain JS666 / ATCC BAA-500) TaxID=296591 RepID=UPI000053415E|nr:ABC transporter permease [Polaromonas sp. JS666]ABE44998.1 amino acid/amide ABC transporter membrane protein 2, HAAT family / amino acid/amide ABC transporter membrane protein 1, HAAT family [Polaromonas sp. JS666]
MTVSVVQLLGGLSYATTLFLMAAGLTLIFGVTRIVNFAHGSFFMLGALFTAHWVTEWFPAWGESAPLYLLAILFGAACAGLVGALADFLLLRRMSGAPELYQLVATFGLTLALHDAMQWGFGPDEVFAPRFPGLKGSVQMGDEFFPVYQLVMIALGPLVWLGLHLLLRHSLFGRRLRAATQDRSMLAALGVNPKPLMLGAVVLGCALAGLGGALQLPREPAHLQMDMNVIVETFVVVVTGGLGSIGGAFVAALLIGLVHALGIAVLPQATLVIVFLTMAAVLVLRPQGLNGLSVASQEGVREPAQRFRGLDLTRFWNGAIAAVLVLLSGLAWQGGAYWQTLAADALILLIFGISLQSMMALGGLVSFGHAAFFALGGYGAALSHSLWGASLPVALAAGCVTALVVAAVFGAAVVRSAGVYLAMLSLALAQVIWAGATQWVSLTGGDNGLIGLALVEEEGRPLFFALLVVLALACVLALRLLSRSVMGAALQAVRDAPARAAASGLPVGWLKYRVFLESAVLAGLAGGLFAAHKGAVFPSIAAVATSVDALLVVLLGGVHQLWGAVVGSAVLSYVSAELGREVTYWRGLLGLFIMLVMVASPSGLLGLLGSRTRPAERATGRAG